MPKRSIIKIDESLCNGCAACIPNCPEGAIQIIGGKARLVSDLFCDGLGACIGTCPQGAITTEEREALAYDEREVMKIIIKQGDDVVKAHLLHLKNHGETKYLAQAQAFLEEAGISIDIEKNSSAHVHMCPGMQARDLGNRQRNNTVSGAANPSELNQWPVQLHLVNPQAAYFDDADLLIAADCVPFAYADFHQRLLKGKVVIIFCPKLDRSSQVYIEKLAEIIKGHDIRSITLAHMEVPCCLGLVHVTQEALRQAGKKIAMHDLTITLQGEMINTSGREKQP